MRLNSPEEDLCCRDAQPILVGFNGLWDHDMDSQSSNAFGGTTWDLIRQKKTCIAEIHNRIWLDQMDWESIIWTHNLQMLSGVPHEIALKRRILKDKQNTNGLKPVTTALYWHWRLVMRTQNIYKKQGNHFLSIRHVFATKFIITTVLAPGKYRNHH